MCNLSSWIGPGYYMQGLFTLKAAAPGPILLTFLLLLIAVFSLHAIHAVSVTYVS